MRNTKRLGGEWNLRLMKEDADLRGWNLADLAREAGLHQSTVSRFFDRSSQTAKTAKRIAVALGHGLDRYYRRKSGVAA